MDSKIHIAAYLLAAWVVSILRLNINNLASLWSLYSGPRRFLRGQAIMACKTGLIRLLKISYFPTKKSLLPSGPKMLRSRCLIL